MVLLNSILFVLAAALIASTSYYYREKRLLKEFMRHSRRHRYHQDLDLVRRQKANRYLTLTIILFCAVVPLLLENFVDDFIENNWKWIIPLVFLSVFARLYRTYIANRNSKMERPLAISLEHASNG